MVGFGCAFTLVSLSTGLMGEASCGCFGRLIQVNPYLTATLDLALVVSLLRWQPKHSFFSIRRAIAAMAVWALTGIPAAYAMASYTPTTLSDTGDILGSSKIVVLEPERWIGKTFPLLDYIDIGDKLKEGKWLVLLYHHDCPRCQEVIAELTKKKEAVSLVCVEVPPYKKNKKLSTACVNARLLTKREWFVSTPVILRVAAGQVMEVSSE